LTGIKSLIEVHLAKNFICPYCLREEVHYVEIIHNFYDKDNKLLDYNTEDQYYECSDCWQEWDKWELEYRHWSCYFSQK